MKKLLILFTFLISAQLFALRPIDQKLIDATRKGDLKLVDQWIKGGADVNAKDIYDSTPLMIAAYRGSSDIVNRLLKETEIDVNLKDYCGKTALILAAKYGLSTIVDILLQRPEIDFNAKDNKDMTALMYSVLQTNTNPQLFDRPCEKDFIDIVNRLSQVSGIDANVKEKERGWTALIIASMYGRSTIDILLQIPEIDVNAKDNDGCTALRHALYSFRTKLNIVNKLLKIPGIDVSEVLLGARKYNNTSLAQLLIDSESFDINKLCDGIPDNGWINYIHEQQKLIAEEKFKKLVQKHKSVINYLDQRELCPSNLR